MFRSLLYIIFTFLFSNLFSQTPKPDKLKLLSQADSVFFTVETSGCMDAGKTYYTFIKLKNNDRMVIFKKDNVKIEKNLTSKNYDVFIYRFRQSVQRFKYADENEKKCTLTTSFLLTNKTQSVDFTNTTCEAEFNPEVLLKQLIK